MLRQLVLLGHECRGVPARDVVVQAVRLLHGCLALTNAAEEDRVGPRSSGSACHSSVEMVQRESGVEASLRWMPYPVLLTHSIQGVSCAAEQLE